MSNQFQVQRNIRVREWQRDMAGAGKVEVSFQVPIEGTAKTGAAVSATDYLNFGVGFYPKKGERNLLTPVFRSGFSIKPQGTQFDPDIPLGYLGFANCPAFFSNDDGFYVGAICHIMVVNLDAEGLDIPFEGTVNLSFLGMAMKSPLDTTPDHLWQGPKSNALIERSHSGGF